MQQLEAYRNLLEKRVISQFDSALHQGDLGMMAECAGVMAEFDSSKTILVQVGQPGCWDALSALVVFQSLELKCA